MSIPREWPNNMVDYRDLAAERIQNANAQLSSLMSRKAQTEIDTVLIVAKATNELNQALRWLERAGAQTQPERL